MGRFGGGGRRLCGAQCVSTLVAGRLTFCSQCVREAWRALRRHHRRTALDARDHPPVRSSPTTAVPHNNKANTHPRYDYLATKTHAIIIPACGFDSLPSDLAAYLGNKTLKAFAGPDSAVDESVSAFKVKGGMSGGTLQTLIAMLEEVPREKLVAGHRAYALSTGAHTV